MANLDLYGKTTPLDQAERGICRSKHTSCLTHLVFDDCQPSSTKRLSISTTRTNGKISYSCPKKELSTRKKICLINDTEIVLVCWPSVPSVSLSFGTIRMNV